MEAEQTFRVGFKGEHRRIVWSRAFVCGTNDNRMLLLSLSSFPAMYVAPPYQLPLPPPGPEAPHRLITRLHISQMLHPPTTLLLLFFLPVSIGKQTISLLMLYFPQICSTHRICPPGAQHAAVRLPSKDPVKEPSNVGAMV